MFLEESDLSPIEEHFDEFIAGLTDWQPETTEKGLVEPEMITVNGSDAVDAITKTRYLFYRNLWSDSLPIEPPTEELVEWILTGTDIDPKEVIGPIRPRGGIATVTSVAVALAMAGGRPEYLPVALAITDALADEQLNTQSWNATTNSGYPVVIVNGPIAKQLRLGSGYGLFGPDPVHPAGQIIGRAIRLILQDIGGALPGTGTMAIMGGMRTTNAVFAEDEEGIPEGWPSVAEQRGYTRDQNIITVTLANSMENVVWDFGGVDANLRSLRAMASHMKAANPRGGQGDNVEGTNGAIVIPRGFAAALKSDNGFSKDDVCKYLWEQSAIPYEELESTMSEHFVKNFGFEPGKPIYYAGTPDNLLLVVAGGDQSGHGYQMAGLGMGKKVSREVELPAAWDDLLYQTEIDLGSLPATH